MKRAAVLGSPITHSLSPAIHKAAYRELGVDADYDAHNVTAEELNSHLEVLLKHDEWIGFSLTMPLKEQICQAAQTLQIEVDERSKRISSANTLYREGKHWYGTSTDVSGFEFLLSDYEMERVAILGAGGTARAALEALPPTAKEIVVFRRSSKRDDQLKTALPQHALQFMEWTEISSAWGYPVVINTVPNSACEEIEGTMKAPNLLVDALYSPWLPPLSRVQMESRRELVTGIDLLCAQALDQIRLMTGKSFDVKDMFTLLKKVALEKVS
jgi:shikimate dehydrogenase